LAFKFSCKASKANKTWGTDKKKVGVHNLK
jgi:hypothetical protein